MAWDPFDLLPLSPTPRPRFSSLKKAWMWQIFPAGSKSTLGWIGHLWDALRGWFVKVNTSQTHRASTHMLEAHSGPSAWKRGLPARGARKAEAGRRSEWLIVMATQPVPHMPGIGDGLSLSHPEEMKESCGSVPGGAVLVLQFVLPSFCPPVLE